MVFYLALLPTLLDLSALTMARLCGTGGGDPRRAGTVVFGGYILLAARARRLFTSARAIRVLNRATGAVMAGAAAAIAFR